MPTSRLRLEPDERHNCILQAGLRVFSRQSYEATSVGDVAREAGMSVGLLYHYFPGKHALFTAAYAHLAERFVVAFSPKAGQAPWTLIDQALTAYMAYARRHPGVILLLLRPPRDGRANTPSLNDALNTRIAGLMAVGLGIRASDTRRRAAIRAWLAFVDRAVLDMIEHGKPSGAQVKALCIKVLHAAIDTPSDQERETP
jgi:AcrR family transcriptional regulator